MLETCLNSFRCVNDQARIIVATEYVPDEMRERFEKEYNIQWLFVEKSQVERRRATCKIELLQEIISSAEKGDQFLVSDVDVYFQGDPFEPFDQHPEMDLGVTTRGYTHAFPINGGIFYIRVSKAMVSWIVWHLDEIYHPTWPPYVRHRRRWHHERYGLDWSVGQDFLVANWMHREIVKYEKGVTICDAGPKYNYCPPTDINEAKAIDDIRAAIGDFDIAHVLHLKSNLKKLIYQDVFPNAVIRYPKGRLGWL